MKVHFLKDSQNVDQYFEWVDNWSTENFFGTRTVKLANATAEYWKTQDLLSSLNYQIQIVVGNQNKMINFSVASQNAITGVKIVSNNLQIGMSNSKAIVYANAKGFNPHYLPSTPTALG